MHLKRALSGGLPAPPWLPILTPCLGLEMWILVGVLRNERVLEDVLSCALFSVSQACTYSGPSGGRANP